jgi:hypothetical protein
VILPDDGVCDKITEFAARGRHRPSGQNSPERLEMTEFPEIMRSPIFHNLVFSKDFEQW